MISPYVYIPYKKPVKNDVALAEDTKKKHSNVIFKDLNEGVSKDWLIYIKEQGEMKDNNFQTFFDSPEFKRLVEENRQQLKDSPDTLLDLTDL